MAFGATSKENKELDRYFGGEEATLEVHVVEGTVRKLKALCNEHNLEVMLLDRARALEAFWSAWKDVEASGVGYSASFTEAAKKLREMEV